MSSLTLDRKKCIGCKFCVDFAQNTFDMSDIDGKAIIIGVEIKDKQSRKIMSFETEDIIQAVKQCPVKAIKLS